MFNYPLAAVVCTAALLVTPADADNAIPVPGFTVAESHFVPVLGKKKTWYVNDSVFPFLPAKDGNGVVAFWGDAIVMRYAGPDLDHLAAPTDEAEVASTDAPGADPSWHRDGTWMLTARRLEDGTLVAFVHGEDHKFADGKYGEWNSTGVWTSTDDGMTWIDHGETVGSKKPDNGHIGGLAMNEVIWDAANKRWLGYSGAIPLISKDPHALPGTWFGYKDGTFSVPIDVTQPHLELSPAPGLADAHVTWGGLTYNSYLKQFVMTWGWGRGVEAAFSPDGVNWSKHVALFKLDPSDKGDISYPFLIGGTDTTSGQDCQLVYMYHPPKGQKTQSGHIKDMIRRPVHFQ
jgi:hypothetical protein